MLEDQVIERKLATDNKPVASPVGGIMEKPTFFMARPSGTH
jgi:hypothetical protein